MEKTSRIKYDILPPKGLVSINFPELWRFRDLLYIFVWRDIKVRYKQTALGIAWAIFQPLLTMLIFSVFFGRLAKVPSDGVPYPIFVYSGLLLWNYFSAALTSASNSMVENENIIKKIYFPRLILPFSTAVTPIVDFTFSLIVLIILMGYYHYTPSLIGILLLPVLLLVALISATGLGLFLASINVKYRDVRYVLPFFIQILMYVSPVIYPISIVPAKFQWLLSLNPMSGILTFARNSLLHTGPLDWGGLLTSVIISAILLTLGLAYFRKTERFFADIL